MAQLAEVSLPTQDLDCDPQLQPGPVPVIKQYGCEPVDGASCLFQKNVNFHCQYIIFSLEKHLNNSSRNKKKFMTLTPGGGTTSLFSGFLLFTF